MAAPIRSQGRGYRANGGEPKNDAYTAMLVIALLAQITAGTFLMLDYMQYPTEKPAALPKPPAVTQAQ